MRMMDEKTLRVLIEAGSVKQVRIIGDGALFHVDVVTAKKGAVTALTAKGSVKTWSTLDATARWIRSLAIVHKTMNRKSRANNKRDAILHPACDVRAFVAKAGQQ
jgi:hypothetical protein